jgi:hypothetical protein
MWSTWEVPGEGEWQGLLIVHETGRADRRAVSVRAISGTMESTAFPGGTFIGPYVR